MRAAQATVAIAAATVLVFVSLAQATSVPTLGVGSPQGHGFGQVKPGRVDYGGDPTSFVSDVKWTSWGGARAIGHGRALWVWPGWCVACGGVELPATVVAFDKTTCQGHSAYSFVEWFFPSRGQSFNRRLAVSNICGGPQPNPPTKLVNCGQVPVRSGAVTARAEHIVLFDSPIGCETARRFVAHSGVARYLGRNARFTERGWWCGSQLEPDVSGPQYFSCAKGDLIDLEFQLKGA